MYPPVTCRCGYPLGDKYATYRKILAKRQDQAKSIIPGLYNSSPIDVVIGDVLDKLHITSLCCRTCIISHTNFYELKMGVFITDE